MYWILTPSLSARYLGLSLGNSSFLGQGLWGLIGQGWGTLGLGVGGVPLVLVYRRGLLEGVRVGEIL
jgi:hypothetical protein